MHERAHAVSLDILAVGSLVRGSTILDAHSTSTLIRTDGMNIVVDTSTRYLLPAMRTSLKQIGVLPKDVDAVVMTHAHHDHCENNDLFRKAKVYVRAEEHFEGDAVSVCKDMDIAPGVRLVHTPGHTHGSMSVFVQGDRRYAITGDAIPLEDNYRRMIPPGINYDPETAMKSIKCIIEYAGVIIPGHGFPFMI